MDELIHAAVLFGSQTLMVTLLVMQSVNNNHGRTVLAALTSTGIGIASLAQWKLMPSAGPIEIAAFIVAGPVGNVIAQWIKRADIAKIKRLT